MAGEDSLIRAAGLDLGGEPLAQPSIKKTTRVRKDFRPGEGTRKRLEKSAGKLPALLFNSFFQIL